MKIKGGRVFTCHGLRDKEKRSLAILESIRKKGTISRTDISKITGINAVSVTNYMHAFVEKKLVLETGQALSSGGRKPELVELNVRENYVVGIDISPTEITAILADIRMGVKGKKRAACPGLKKREIADTVCELVDDMTRSSGITRAHIKATGVGIYESSLLDVPAIIEERTGIPAYVACAVDCGAYAEKIVNPKADVDKFLYIYSDLGHGVVIDGDVRIESPGICRELQDADAGTLPDSPDERQKYLKPWDRRLGIAETAKREVSRGVGTGIVSFLSGKGIEALTEDIVINAARQKDETALSIVQSVAMTLGLRIAYLINLFDTRVVIVGGGPEKAVDLIFPLIEKMVKKLSLRKYAGSVVILPGTPDGYGLCLGAAAFAMREVFIHA